mgnify:CR=1 FL=1
MSDDIPPLNLDSADAFLPAQTNPPDDASVCLALTAVAAALGGGDADGSSQDDNIKERAKEYNFWMHR